MKHSPIKAVVYAAIMGAMMVMVQVVLASLPNIELVSFLVLVFTLFNPRMARGAIAVFVLLEGVLYGFGMWWFTSLYIWYVLHFVVLLVRRYASALFCALICGAYGLIFGTLTAVPYFFTLGAAGGFSYIIAGIPYDILHCIGNFTLTLILYKPAMKALDILKNAGKTKPAPHTPQTEEPKQGK